MKMDKDTKILGLLIVIVVAVLGVYFFINRPTMYENVKEVSSVEKKYYAGEYFTILQEWNDYKGGDYKIMYANDTKVKYFMYSHGIFPLLIQMEQYRYTVKLNENRYRYNII